VNITQDPIKGTVWAFTEKAVFRYKVIREERNVWQVRKVLEVRSTAHGCEEGGTKWIAKEMVINHLSEYYLPNDHCYWYTFFVFDNFGSLWATHHYNRLTTQVVIGSLIIKHSITCVLDFCFIILYSERTEYFSN
jgi:hypothetical protein